MSKRDTLLDKAIKDLDQEMAILAKTREKLLALRNRADLEAARPSHLKPVSAADLAAAVRNK